MLNGILMSLEARPSHYGNECNPKCNRRGKMIPCDYIKMKNDLESSLTLVHARGK